MSQVANAALEDKQDDDSRMVEDFLKRWFPETKAYRYNSASIRIRIIDPSFEGLSREQRNDLVEPYLDQLPIEMQRDIVFLLTIAPSDMKQSPATFREFMRNIEFEHPSPSTL